MVHRLCGHRVATWDSGDEGSKYRCACEQLRLHSAGEQCCTCPRVKAWEGQQTGDCTPLSLVTPTWLNSLALLACPVHAHALVARESLQAKEAGVHVGRIQHLPHRPAHSHANSFTNSSGVYLPGVCQLSRVPIHLLKHQHFHVPTHPGGANHVSPSENVVLRKIWPSGSSRIHCEHG